MSDSPSEQARLSHNELRRQLIPNIGDAEGQGMIPFPYVMLLPLPGYTSPTATADECGFRISIKAGRRLKRDKLKAVAVSKGVFLGNGIAWGTGTSDDSKVVHNVLNDTRPSEVWYSVALRATSMTQERISAELFAPLDVTHAVWLSGIRMLHTSLYKVPHNAIMPFPGEDRFMAAMGGPTYTIPDFSMEARWAELMTLFEREMVLFSRAFRPPATNIIFALQAGLGWCKKPLSPEERDMTAAAGADKGASVIDPDAFTAYILHFAKSAEKICARHGVTFINVAAQPEFLVPEWLFADGGHLTDAGHAALARVIARHLK